jgi:ABC-type multidrug transport system permease subunit
MFPTKEGNVVLYIGGGILYLVLLVTLGILCLRKGHWVMFIIGFFVPLFWLIGAVIGPTATAARRTPA